MTYVECQNLDARFMHASPLVMAPKRLLKQSW